MNNDDVFVGGRDHAATVRRRRGTPAPDSYFAAPTCDHHCHHSHLVHHHDEATPQAPRGRCHAKFCGCTGCTCAECRQRRGGGQ